MESSQGVVGRVVLSALFAGCTAGCAASHAAVPSAPLVTAITSVKKTPLVVAPDGFVLPPVKDPTGNYVGWLDLRYAETEGATPESQSLDLIGPVRVVGGEQPPVRKLPIIVFVHGGAWSTGDKRAWLESRAPRFADAGFLFASINYRLAPQCLHPAQIMDTAAALAWLHHHAAAFGGDPDALVVMGYSSGAYLAALVATDERWLDAQGQSLALLRGVVLLDGASYDLVARSGDFKGAERIIASAFGPDRAVWADASPTNHIGPGKSIPPFLAVHAGKHEESERETRELAEKLRAAGVRVDVVHAETQNHGTISRDLGGEGDATTTRVLEFVSEMTGRNH